MDRFDEPKPIHNQDDEREEREERAEQQEREEPVREGDILGLGGAPVPKAPGDPTTAHDPESVARRRERASGLDEPGLADANEDLPASGIGPGIGRPELDRKK